MIIDLTHTITPEMPMYPGSAAPSIKPTGSPDPGRVPGEPS